MFGKKKENKMVWLVIEKNIYGYAGNNLIPSFADTGITVDH